MEAVGTPDNGDRPAGDQKEFLQSKSLPFILDRWSAHRPFVDAGPISAAY